MAFLEVSGLSKHFGEGDNRVQVLDDVNLKVEEGEFIAIVGFSGSGKTTLISAMAGLQAPDLGGVIYNCLLYTSPSPRDLSTSRMPSSA